MRSAALKLRLLRAICRPNLPVKSEVEASAVAQAPSVKSETTKDDADTDRFEVETSRVAQSPSVKSEMTKEDSDTDHWSQVGHSSSRS